MNTLNTLILEGNAVDKAELKETLTTKVATVTLSIHRLIETLDGNKTEEVCYFDVVSYGNLAEIMAEEITKGRGVRVVGRLKQERWTDSDGKNRSKVVVIAEHIELKPIVKKEIENVKKEDC